MSKLFQTSRSNVVEHIRNIYNEGELNENSTCRKFRQVRVEDSREVTRNIPYYNLERGRKDYLDTIKSIDSKIDKNG